MRGLIPSASAMTSRKSAGRPPVEISREEYLHLLDTAKGLQDERAYLLVKVFVTTGITISELPELTVEAARSGRLMAADRDIALPLSLQNELLSYALRRGIQTGPVFASRGGQPFGISRVSNILRGLCASAGLGEGKSRPSTLRKLYFDERMKAEAKTAGLVEQFMNRQADEEQRRIADGKV